jgi:hypothetical protein
MVLLLPDTAMEDMEQLMDTEVTQNVRFFICED